MLFKDNHFGFLISLTIHLLVMLIPVSLVQRSNDRFLELYFEENTDMRTFSKKIETPERKIKRQNKTKINKHQDINNTVVEEINSEKLEQKESIPDIDKSDAKLESDMEKIRISKENIGEKKEDSLMSHDTTKSAIETDRVINGTNKGQDGHYLLNDVEFGAINGPSFLYRDMPSYPLIAKRLGKEGKILLRLTIDERGKLLDIEVIEGANYGFTEAAIDAVKKSTFLPAKINGKPVMSKALLTIRFILRSN